MNTDKFNNVIQEKLLGIEPQFEDDDWKEMQSLLVAPNRLFWDKYGQSIIYSSGIILLLTSLFFNLKQNYDNKSLLQTNRILRTQATQKQENVVPGHPDTVYVTRYVTKWKVIREAELAPGATKNKQSIVVQSVDNGMSASKNPISPSLENNESPLDKENRLTSANEKPLPASNKENQAFSTNKNEPAKQAKTSDEAPVTLAATEIEKLSVPSSTNEKNPKSSGESENKGENVLPKNVSDQTELIQKEKRKTSLSPSKLKYRWGISFDAGNEQIGGGLTSDIILHKNLSLNAGLRLMKYSGNTYFTADQYNFDTNDDFRTRYASFVPPGDDIINISFQNYLFQLPLGLTYRYPLKKDYTLLTSLGTNFDLYVEQYVIFDYKENSSQFDQGEYSSAVSNRFFNSIDLSIGLEKKIGKYIFQAHPYISVPLKRVDYKNEEFEYGAKIRILYGKK